MQPLPSSCPPAARPQPPPSSFYLNLLAGGGAGIIETIVTYPLDLVRTRIQMQRGSSGSNSTTVGGLLVRIAREEGVLPLFRGLLPPLLTEFPRRALKFSANEMYKQRLLLLNGGQQQHGNGAYGYDGMNE